MVDLKFHRINLVLLLACGGIGFPLLWLCLWAYRLWGWQAGLASAICALIVGPAVINVVLLLVAVFTTSKPRDNEDGQ